MIRQALNLTGFLNAPSPKRLLSPPYRAGKSAGRHDALEALSADILNNPEQAADARDFRRLINENTDIENLAHSAALSIHSDSAIAQNGSGLLSSILTNVSVESVGNRTFRKAKSSAQFPFLCAVARRRLPLNATTAGRLKSLPA